MPSRLADGASYTSAADGGETGGCTSAPPPAGIPKGKPQGNPWANPAANPGQSHRWMVAELGRKGSRAAVSKNPGPWKLAHPTVSFRVTQEDRERLNRLQCESGRSLGDLLHDGLFHLEQDQALVQDWTSEAEREGWTAGFEAGLKKGRTEGRESAAYVLRVPCSRCGRGLDLDFRVRAASPLYWRFVRQEIERLGWHHSSCLRPSLKRE